MVCKCMILLLQVPLVQPGMYVCSFLVYTCTRTIYMEMPLHVRITNNVYTYVHTYYTCTSDRHREHFDSYISPSEGSLRMVKKAIAFTNITPSSPEMRLMTNVSFPSNTQSSMITIGIAIGNSTKVREILMGWST